MSDQERPDLLDEMGALLSAKEFARVLGRSLNAFYKLSRTGAFRDFIVHPALPPRIYSKAVIRRYLNGERIDQPARVFGRKRSA